MNFGADYSGVYDALYRDKDYAAEAQFALRQLRTVLKAEPVRMLDLGCGTGQHALHWARNGRQVTGIDRSADMIGIAQRHKAAQPAADAKLLRFELGDIRSFDLHEHYDAVLSLFHVLCYMVETADLAAALRTARRHLTPGGAFIFDYWHDQAVIENPPQRAERTVTTPEGIIHRTATPEWDPRRRLVHVRYDIAITGTTSGQVTHLQKTHTVRYFSQNELRKQLTAHGFEVVRFGEWLTDAPPSAASFGVYCLALAR